MTRFLITACIYAWLASTSLAQLAVTTRDVIQVVGLEESEEINGYVFVNAETKIKKQKAALVFAETEAKGISFEVSDKDRSPVEFQQISDTAILVSAAGKSWVEIVAIDFDKQIYSKKLVVVEVDGQVDPEPDPKPDDIANDYGLGKIAAENAPEKGKEEVASAYESAANFLYGRPKAQTVQETLDYLQEQTEAIGGSEWESWQSLIAKALKASQEKTDGGYTKQDWYGAYMEIANALRYKDE
tara:strand:- start:278 stop:1006 length:729 start_codon:yes stop_codon:yes gene_type:complete